MRIFVAVALLQALTFALNPEDCSLVVRDEEEYSCPLPNGTITLKAKKNDYVNLICEATVVNCKDIPRFNFASDQRLESIGLKKCPSKLLSCVNEIIRTPSITRVTMVQMTEPLSEEDVINLGDINTLTIREAVAQTTIPIAAIKNLRSLREVRLGGGNMQLTPNVFEGAPPLVYLELGQDHLSSIPVDSFNGLPTLQRLNLWGNNIVNISVGAFRGLGELKKLALSTNNMKYMEPGTFDDMPKLGDLYLMKNPLEMIPDGLLSNLKELQNITIKLNTVNLTFGDNALSNLPSLKTILFEYNKIKTLPGTVFSGSKNIESLMLRNNCIEELPENVFSTLQSLKTLNLSRNKIKIIASSIFYGIKNLEKLDMSHNLLENLPGDLFAGLSHLKEINFDSNRIVYIATSTFGGLTSLNLLSMKKNKLTLNADAYGSLDKSISYSPFVQLTKLKKLYLSGNEIQTIFEDWRFFMYQLEELDLSHNKIPYVMFDPNPFAGNFLSPNLTVDLRYNEIERIYTSVGPKFREPGQQRTTMLLDNNPFICNCHLYNVKLRLDGIVNIANEPKLVLNDASCALPLDLKDIHIRDVPSNRLVCTMSENSPDNCTTIARPATNELILNCPRFPSQIPDTKNSVMHDFFYEEPTITVKSKHPPVSLEGLNVHKLDLSNAGLKSIDFKPSEDLKILNLSNNNIKSVPMAFVDANVILYLLNNSLECDCWNVDDIATLKSYEYVYNATCDGDRAIDHLDIQGLCNFQKAIVVSVGTFLIIVCCALFTVIIIYKYFNEIIIYMISRGICKGCVKDIKSDKLHDVFISFAHNDLDLVQECLLPKLEKEFGQKVWIHYRDWDVGELIPNQINSSVENSRKTVIILSKHFLDSMWSNLEFLTAHNLTRQENSSRIILIVLDEDLTSHPKLSAELRAYIKTNTYLLWNDPNFWKKLDKALERNTYRITWLEAFKQKTQEKKPLAGGLDVHLHNGQLINIASQNGGVTNNLPYDSV